MLLRLMILPRLLRHACYSRPVWTYNSPKTQKKPYSLHLPSRKQSLSVAQMPVVPSIVSRIPRLLLQSLTTFIPSMRPRRIFAVHDDPVNSSTCNGTSDFRPLPTACKYVARAVQLKKLKLQLDNERLLGMEHLDSRCKKCYGRPILL